MILPHSLPGSSQLVSVGTRVSSFGVRACSVGSSDQPLKPSKVRARSGQDPEAKMPAFGTAESKKN